MSAHGIKSMIAVITRQHIAAYQFVRSVDVVCNCDTCFCFCVVGTAVIRIRTCSVCMEPDHIFVCFFIIKHLRAFHNASLCPEIYINVFLLIIAEITVQILEVIVCLELVIIVHCS